MTTANVVDPSLSTVAPLTNVGLAQAALKRAIERPAHLPGLVAFYGPSGFGKTVAASYVANKHRAFYVECKSTWTKKALLLAILTEMGVAPERTIYDMADQVAAELMLSRRPLIIDECDHIVEKKAVELIRDIYEASNAPILMIGEELFPAKLKKWERFSNRVLHWQPAQPATMDDVRHLARLYVPKAELADDMLEEVLRQSRQSVRRIAVNLENVRIYAEKNGIRQVSLSEYKGDLYTGEAPQRRAFK